MFGNCKDKLCEDKEEPAELQLFRGVWRCVGCVEAILDHEDEYNANYQDMVESGWL